MDSTLADQAYREVMTCEAAAPGTPFEAATRDFVFGEVWRRPGSSSSPPTAASPRDGHWAIPLTRPGLRERR